MVKRIRQAAIMMSIAFAVFIFAPVLIDETVYAAKADERDWEEFAPDGELIESATSSNFVVLIDAHTGKVIYEENANEKQYPASITKIMTCLLVLENNNLDDMVEVKEFTLSESKATAIGIVQGEKISVRDLLYGLMLPSGNDAAIALAMHVSGSVTAFAQLMNEKAAELIMTNTHFVNPHGLHDEEHYTTAMDMAKLAYVAMQNEEFKEIVSTYKYTPAQTNIHNEENLWDPDIWKNTNDLVSTVYDDIYAFNDKVNGHAIGIKTGHTSAAEYTLVSAAENVDGTQEVIAVVLKGTPNGRFLDSITMFMYAFEFYDTINLGELLAREFTVKTHVENATNSDEYDNLKLNVVPKGEAYMTDEKQKIEMIKSHPELFTHTETYSAALTAPIAIGQEVGTVNFYFNGESEPILTCTLIAANDVQVMTEATPVVIATPEPVATPTAELTGIIGIIDKNKYIITGVVAIILIIILIIFISRRNKYRGSRYNSTRNSAQTRGRRADSRFKDGVNRGRGRKR